MPTSTDTTRETMLRYFEAGHMIYIHGPSLARMAGELRAFVGAV